MTYRYELFDRDFRAVLFTTTVKVDAEKFLRDSGFDWLPISVEWGERWTQHWTGRLELRSGTASMHSEAEYLKHLLVWPEMQ